MEKKKVFKGSNSFRTLFNSRSAGKYLFRRFNNSPRDAFLGFLKGPKGFILHFLSISKSEGFTLIELILVVGILSVLAVAALAVLDPFAQIQKANDSRRKSDLSQIQRALETYYQDNGKYPLSTVTTPYKISVPGSPNPVTIDWGNSWQPYMNLMPKDPSASKNYVYYSITGQSYFLYASLDRGKFDPQACNSGNACLNLPSGASCGSGTCNFGATSPNVSP